MYTCFINSELIAGTNQGHPSVKEATHYAAGQEESGSDRSYLNGLVEATALAKDDQVRKYLHSGRAVTIGRAVAIKMYRVIPTQMGALDF